MSMHTPLCRSVWQREQFEAVCRMDDAQQCDPEASWHAGEGESTNTIGLNRINPTTGEVL